MCSISVLLQFNCSVEKTFISRYETLSNLKALGMRFRDLKLIQRLFDREDKSQRQIIAPRPSSNSIIIFLENLKVDKTYNCFAPTGAHGEINSDLCVNCSLLDLCIEGSKKFYKGDKLQGGLQGGIQERAKDKRT